MSIERNINYADQITTKRNNELEKNNQFVNVMTLPQNFAFTSETWYENGPDDFLYYPYKHKFGAPNQNWHEHSWGIYELTIFVKHRSDKHNILSRSFKGMSLTNIFFKNGCIFGFLPI